MTIPYYVYPVYLPLVKSSAHVRVMKAPNERTMNPSPINVCVTYMRNPASSTVICRGASYIVLSWELGSHMSPVALVKGLTSATLFMMKCCDGVH